MNANIGCDPQPDILARRSAIHVEMFSCNKVPYICLMCTYTCWDSRHYKFLGLSSASGMSGFVSSRICSSVTEPRLWL